MSIYYPQASVKLRVTWEDFGTGSKVLNETSDIDIVCKSINVERNDYSEADTVKLTIDYKAFPFDPRCVRACGISVFMQNREKHFDKDGREVRIVPNDLDIDKEGANKVFIGFADESSIRFDTESKTISIEGRDYTALLIDAKRINTSPIPLSKPIDQVIQDLLNEQLAYFLILRRTKKNPYCRTISHFRKLDRLCFVLLWDLHFISSQRTFNLLTAHFFIY
jgi:hypothetical protein